MQTARVRANIDDHVFGVAAVGVCVMAPRND